MKARSMGIAAGLMALAGAGVQMQIGAPRGDAAASSRTLHIRESNGQYVFLPIRVTVKQGTKVTWVNNSDAPHTVSGSKGWHFASKMFSQNQRVSYTFTKAGTYHYYCAVHPYMKATVVVQK